MNCLILTPEQANTVRNNYGPGFRLDPVLRPDLGEGVHILPARILSDARFADAHAALAGCPQQDVGPAPEPDID